MGLDEVLEIARQIAEAVKVAPEKGVIHHDLMDPSRFGLHPQELRSIRGS
jgi:hypothetical protein